MYRVTGDGLEVLIAHPGGPYFARKDEGAWSLPKGLVEAGEDEQQAARREFDEEIGWTPDGPLQALGEVRQKGGKTVVAWAVEGDLPAGFVLRSNTFELEWPPRSGKRQSFPEIDRAEFVTVEVARRKLLVAQVAFLDELLTLLAD